MVLDKINLYFQKIVPELNVTRQSLRQQLVAHFLDLKIHFRHELKST